MVFKTKSNSQNNKKSIQPTVFIIHKVDVNTPYDKFTKKPYHKQILAIKAISNSQNFKQTSNSFENSTPEGLKQEEKVSFIEYKNLQKIYSVS